jgi:hypothetical protein
MRCADRQMTLEKSSAPDDPGALRRAARWLFADRGTGRYVVAQWPNLPLGAYLAGTIALQFLHHGPVEHAVRTAATCALIVWAVWEVARGVNPFRKGLGAAVLVLTIVNLLIT